MQNLRRLVICLIIISFAIGALAQNNYTIRHISIRGNKTFDKQFLLDAMSLQEVSFVEKLFTKNERSLYSKEMVDLDLQRLKNTYQSEGFLNVQTTLGPLEINEKKQTVNLEIQIEEGDPVLVDSVLFQTLENINHINSDSLFQRLSKRLELKKGKRFRDEDLYTDIALIEDEFKSLGYAYVTVDYDLNLKPNEFTTGVSFILSSGPETYIGETQITGNKKVSEEFIRKQLKYNKGDLYNRSLLNKTRQDLYQLQLFRIVSVLPQVDTKTQKNPVDINIKLDEAPRITTDFGAGYGTEDKFRAFLDLNYNGFLSGARRINLSLKHSALNPYLVNLRWIQPQLFGITKSSIIINPFIRRNEEPGYRTQSYGFNTALTYQFNPQLNNTFSYYLENVQQTVEPGDPEFTDMESTRFPYNKSGILYSSVFDNSSPKFSPEKGMILSAGIKVNGYLFGGDFNYTRLMADYRAYRKIGGVVVAFRIMAGGITSNDQAGFIPVEDRFYSGGSNSVRGWNRADLGPKRNSGSPLGGKSILEGNLEFRYKLFWRLNGVTFLDAGNVWLPSFDYHFDQLAYAGGVGLRIKTPIGPVRFDLGFPLWNEKKSPQLFISVGQAF